ncbi:MAG: RNA polymerase subunit sigma [Deltaproteobacteria bacterium]|nr:RNA polymerase subunit sigma [Deltaproteobacteria bacterium]
MTQLPPGIDPLLDRARAGAGPVVLLTGAGISAESGIPTFRGEEGYWKVGSRNYHPQEMATHAAFVAMPDEVWAWYLYRRSVCRAAAPNAAHLAVAELERELENRFVLVTQNVDGLHLRAGNSPERTYQIHGNIDFMRCAKECSTALVPLPAGIDPQWNKGRAVGEAERTHLRCPRCGGRARPHVLWFDECYDEERFRFESSMRAAARAELLVVVGTAGQTNLPLQIGSLVARRGAPMVVVGPEPSPFTAFAERSGHGLFLQGTAGDWVPPLCRRIAERRNA